MKNLDDFEYDLVMFRWRVENPGRAGRGIDPLFGDDGSEEMELSLRLPRGAWREVLQRIDAGAERVVE